MCKNNPFLKKRDEMPAVDGPIIHHWQSMQGLFHSATVVPFCSSNKLISLFLAHIQLFFSDFVVFNQYFTVLLWKCAAQKIQKETLKVCFSLGLLFLLFFYSVYARTPMAFSSSFSEFIYFLFSFLHAGSFGVSRSKNMPFLGIHFHPSRIFNLSNFLSVATCSWKSEIILTFLAIFFLCSIDKLSMYMRKMCKRLFLSASITKVLCSSLQSLLALGGGALLGYTPFMRKFDPRVLTSTLANAYTNNWLFAAAI